MKRCSTSPIIRKMHIQTTVSYYHTFIRMAIIKNKPKKKRAVLARVVEKPEHLCPVAGSVEWCSLYSKEHSGSSNIKDKISM